jgi:quinoprotein dehydrogenase-associated probable ABC transporter substrate-binding protein
MPTSDCRVPVSRLRHALLPWGVAIAVLCCVPAAKIFADEPAVDARKALRVCADPNNLPFSNEKGEGYENKIAELFARELGLPLKYYFLSQRFNFVRNTLRFKLPGEDYRCDVMMGVPVGFDQVSGTKPYYRSTYALVYVKGRKLDQVAAVEDLFKLDANTRKTLRIGVYDRSPASEWLAKHGLLEQGVPYRMLNAHPDFYPGEILEKDLVKEKIDAAIVWGPVAGFSATRVKPQELVVIPMKSEPGVKFDYQIAMGVRYGEPKWKAQMEQLIERNRSQIVAILRSFGVPLIDDKAELVQEKVNR